MNNILIQSKSDAVEYLQPGINARQILERLEQLSIILSDKDEEPTLNPIAF